jgi:hypothetical protein
LRAFFVVFVVFVFVGCRGVSIGRIDVVFDVVFDVVNNSSSSF